MRCMLAGIWSGSGDSAPYLDENSIFQLLGRQLGDQFAAVDRVDVEPFSQRVSQ